MTTASTSRYGTWTQNMTMVAWQGSLALCCAFYCRPLQMHRTSASDVAVMEARVEALRPEVQCSVVWSAAASGQLNVDQSQHISAMPKVLSSIFRKRCPPSNRWCTSISISFSLTRSRQRRRLNPGENPYDIVCCGELCTLCCQA